MHACPYPSCQKEAQQPLGEARAATVYRCAACHRLARICQTHQCGALNRPLSSYCRHCGAALARRRGQPLVDDLWREAGRFAEGDALQTPGASTLLVELSRLEGYQRSAATIEMSFCDGLLAVHQSGGFLALVHPLGDAASETAKVWSLPEPQGEEGRRPYPPLRVAPGRFLVFAAPHAAYSIDAWGLPGWCAAPTSAWRTLADCRQRAGYELAAQGVPLPGNRLGLLFVDSDRRYSWGVVDLEDPQSRVDFSRLTSLDLDGGPLQWRLAAGRALLLTTPSGQWAWKLEDAASQNTSALLQTWPRGDRSGSLILDAQVQDPREWAWSRQAISELSFEGAAADAVVCYFQRQVEHEKIAECYRLDLANWQADLPRPLRNGRGSAPLGLRIAKDGRRQMAFLRGNTLLYEQTLGELQPVPGTLAGGGQINGVIFADPLLMCIVAGAATESVRLFPVQDPNHGISIDDLQLTSDPVLWSHWLFTCERDKDQVSLVRRNLSGSDSPGDPKAGAA